MNAIREELLNLIKNDAYFREKIVLSSGKTSEYYIDARRVTLLPVGVNLCAQLILEKIKEEDFDAIGGPTLGADPLIGAIGVLGVQSNVAFNTFIIRKAPKKHGKQRQIEGPDLKAGSRVILIDDVATTGKAFLESIDVLKKMDVQILKCICLVDRGEGAQEAVAEKGCVLESIFKIAEIHK